MERAEAISRLKLLQGKNLHEIAKEFRVTVISPEGKQNKGWAGQAIERFLGLQLNSSRDPNFGSWELKLVPLKYLKGGKLSFKETMAITMIDAQYVGQTPFEKSHLLTKLRRILVVSRTVGDKFTDPSYVFSSTPVDLADRTYKTVETDYKLIQSCINDPKRGFDALTGKMGELIQPRTKGAGNGSTTRAFYARKVFLNLFIDLSESETFVRQIAA